jgi:O-acetylhomoserine/O-acetylserine sulfhydrylase-like pyridoxal-dependent enzyme
MYICSSSAAFKLSIMENKQHVETIAVHGAQNDHVSGSDIIQPIHLSTTFERRADGSLNDHVYTESATPTG